MASVILDASALLAYILREPGADVVAAAMDEAVISTVNLAEAISRLVLTTGSYDRALELVEGTEVAVANFDQRLAQATGALASLTRSKGLSLGDRACLALAQRENAIALTADQAWNGVSVGVEIQFIR